MAQKSEFGICESKDLGLVTYKFFGLGKITNFFEYQSPQKEKKKKKAGEMILMPTARVMRIRNNT